MSDWKEEGTKRRDARLDTSDLETAKIPPKRKNTKEHCKGKKGKEHQWVYKESHHSKKSEERVCRNCGKIDEVFYNWDYDFKSYWERRRERIKRENTIIYECPNCGSNNFREENNILICLNCDKGEEI